MTDYVRYEPGRGYVKVDVPKRQQRGDLVLGVISFGLVGLLVVGFALSVLVSLAARIFG